MMADEKRVGTIAALVEAQDVNKRVGAIAVLVEATQPTGTVAAIMHYKRLRT